MSQEYRCNVSIENFRSERTEEIVKAIKDFWCFTEVDTYAQGTEFNTITSEAEGNMRGPEKDFARDLAIEIWKANQDKCEVSVFLLCLEDLPYESFCFDEDDYIEIMAKS